MGEINRFRTASLGPEPRKLHFARAPCGRGRTRYVMGIFGENAISAKNRS